MCRCSCVWFFLLNFIALSSTAPGSQRSISAEAETTLNKFLNVYLDQIETNGVSEGDLEETMQGDQPQEENTIQQIGPTGRNLSIDYSRAMRNRSRENRIQELKDTILKYIGRKPEDDFNPNTSVNISEILPNILNMTHITSDDPVTEKIRSFYPSCEIPVNTDQDLWKDDDVMNLYFNFDILSDTRNTNIATATLRLYRLPDNTTKSNSKLDCDNLSSTEEEKLMRISVYWYTKSLKKRRVKKRLSDSRVIPESAKWVELSIKPATKAWGRGRNLGLGVLVEDQEGNILRADRLFKGTSCTVGISTPRPIPTIIVDAVHQTNQLEGVRSLLGHNTTSTLHSDIHLLPIVDICTLEFPDNYTLQSKSRINACNLRKIHEHNQYLAEKDRLERIVTSPMAPPPPQPHQRHIRHQRQHMVHDEPTSYDIRSRIVGSKIILRHEDLQNLTNNKLNLSMINR